VYRCSACGPLDGLTAIARHNDECGTLGERSYRAGRELEPRALPRMVRVLGRFVEQASSSRLARVACFALLLVGACSRVPTGVTPMCTVVGTVNDAPFVLINGDTLTLSARIPFRVPCDSVEAYR
jgi:hypothetical protein